MLGRSGFKLSESRGKEAAGIAVRTGKSIYVFKEPVSASNLIKSEKYNDIFHRIIKEEGYADKDLRVPFAFIGHSRLVTNGQSELNSNNQPVIKDGAVGIHNGIIVNDSDLWAAFPALKRKYDVDTEVFLSLLQMSRNGAGSLVNAVKKLLITYRARHLLPFYLTIPDSCPWQQTLGLFIFVPAAMKSNWFSLQRNIY